MSKLAENNIVIEAKNLCKYFPVSKKTPWEEKKFVKAVDGVSFAIKEGETFGLVGESGCGKSTTGFMLNGLITPTSGEIDFENENMAELKGKKGQIRRKNMQIIFQDPYSSLNPRKKIGSILEEPLIIHKQGNKIERKKKVSEMFEIVGFDSKMQNRLPYELSGGQRQRVGIARALMLNPKFIICDEPVSALDVSVQSQILNLMEELQVEFNLTYLFISHDLNVVYHMSDRVAVMYLGKIVEMATVDEIYKNPLHPYTISLLSAVPSYGAEPNAEKIILTGDVPNPANPPKGCAFHPRCPQVMNICKQVAPTNKEIGKGHFTSCHLYKD